MEGLFSLFGLPVTPYAICLAAAVTAGVILLILRSDKTERDSAYVLAAVSVPSALICARLFWLLARYDFAIEVGIEGCLQLNNGGYALWGAVGGVALAALITAKKHGISALRLTDMIAPSGALCIAVCRFAEYFTGEGIGPEVQNEALWFFPVSVCNEWEEWYYAIFMLEGVTALIIMFVTLRRRKRTGDTTRLFLIIYSASQVLLESLRRDNCLKWLFVRVSQLTAVLVLLLLIVTAIIRRQRAHSSGNKVPVRLIADAAVFFVFVGLCVALEFAYDKAAFLDNRIGYAIMLCCCAGLGCVTADISLRY